MTDFETNLRRVLKKKFGQEKGDEYMSPLRKGADNSPGGGAGRHPRKRAKLTDHGPKHIRHVLENVFKLLDGDLKYFSAIEHYILGLSVLFHDVGNLYGRKDHNKRVARFYDHVRQAPKFDQEKSLIVQIAQAHTGEALNGSRNTLADVPKASQLDGEPIRREKLRQLSGLPMNSPKGANGHPSTCGDMAYTRPRASHTTTTRRRQT